MSRKQLYHECLAAPGRHAAREATYEPYRIELERHKRQSLETTAQQLDRCRCPFCGGLIMPYWIEAVVIAGNPPRKIMMFPDRHGCNEEAAAMLLESESENDR